MSGAIAAVEDAIIDEANTRLAGKIRTADSLPGAWSIDTLKRILQQAPAVFVSFVGARSADTDDDVHMDARFVVYVVAGQASGSAARQRGSAQEIGAYEMLETLVPWLHRCTIVGRGSLALQQIGQEINEATFDLGATVYSATFTMPNLHWPLDGPDLDAFEIAHIDYDLDLDSDAEPVQEDTINLDQ